MSMHPQTEAARYTCGPHGKLTAREIARISGISVKTVYGRLQNGIRGEALYAPRHASLGKAPKTYDCGAHGQLAVSAIVALADISESTVYKRLRDGVRGAALCAPPASAAERVRRRHGVGDYRTHSMLHVGTASQVEVGMRLMQRYGNTAPTVAQLVDAFGMSRATAQRHRAAYKNVLGEP